MKALEDHFETYFAEKLWEMIPSIYRHEDGLAENPGVLRAIVEVMAEQAAILRRSQDRLWEDQFVETASDWAVPYLADLVATRLLPLENKRGRRVDVAKTIYYRRRKGTLRVLEELISDIAGWEGKVVENFHRLGRARHGLDPHPAPLAGRFSQTQPGGWADLRRQFSSEQAGGPFDEYHYTPDMRQHQGTTGRYNIPKLAFHLYRLKSYKVEDVTPFVDAANPERFTFDPSGRSIPLFIQRNRGDDYDWDNWHSALEWEVPAPVRCRLLNHAEYLISERVVQALEISPGIPASTSTELREMSGWRFRSEVRLRTTLDSTLSTALNTGQWLALLHHAIVENCGKYALLPDTDPLSQKTESLAVEDAGTLFSPETTSAANLATWAVAAQAEKNLIVDPERGRFTFVNMAPLPDPTEVTASYHYGFSGEIGAGTYPRPEVESCEPTEPTKTGGGLIHFSQIPQDGVLQIDDSKTYKPVHNRGGIINTRIQAANHQRPFLCLQNASNEWVLEANSPTSDSNLALEGLWVGAVGAYVMILRGDYECVTISYCTIDPGGSADITGAAIFPLHLFIEGTVEKMLIDSSIMGPIAVRDGGVVEELTIRDSIIQSVDAGTPALQFDQGVVNIERTTVFGKVELHRLFATETLITDLANVTDTQSGCFRFSAALKDSRLPQPYESYFFTDNNHWFTSRVFGQPGYGQLSDTAPEELKRGAENQSEIGAFSSLINPIKLDSLQVKVEEYMPFGLIPIFINET